MAQVKVPGYTYKTSSGKTVKVAAHTRNDPNAKGLTRNRKKPTAQQKKKTAAEAKARRRRLHI
jgi:hypothetical protein